MGGLADLNNVARKAAHSLIQSRYRLRMIMATRHVVQVRSFGITDDKFRADI